MADEHYTYQDRITSNPHVMVGKPVVKGTRILVERVVAHLANNPDLNDLFAAYPERFCCKKSDQLGKGGS
jgi:uncharacterized protein (DUF433 family)